VGGEFVHDLLDQLGLFLLGQGSLRSGVV
jgi:hypothetical protein